MSGIFGLIHMDGQPVVPEHFKAMSDEMASWGPDGTGSILSGSAAFGHALLAVTHESRFEKLPYFDADQGILFTAAARLDNRDELCDSLDVTRAERPTTSDGSLVLRAYKKWGSESCRHIFGDWSFAAWHVKEKRLFLARDRLGNTGLYYYFKAPLIVFAAHPAAILAHPEVPRDLDELQLAGNLGIDIQDKDWSRTFWKDIRYLLSAHTMTIAGTDRKIENYWRLDEAPPVRLGSDSAYLEGFLEHLRRAVRVRLNSIRPVGTLLSAGLDSGALTALAAETLQQKNQPLVAYTSVPLHPVEKLFPDHFTDEWPLAHEAAKRYHNIEHVPIRADDITPLDSLQRSLAITQAPQHAAPNMFWIVSLFEHARRRNTGVLLTGQLGNGGVSWSGGRDYIFHFFVRNQWRKGMHALAAWKKRHGSSWFRAVKSQILRPVLLPLRSEFQRLWHPEKRYPSVYSFPQREFIRRLGFNQPSETIFSLAYINPLEERILTTIRTGTMVGPIFHSFGAYYNMEIRDPTADVRLLEYCMGVPVEQDTYEGGQRMLIRRAMSGILPETVRWNTIRGKQAADVACRIMEQRADVERQLAEFQSTGEVTRYIDIAAMKLAWEALTSSFSSATPSLIYAFLRAFNTAYFLLTVAAKKNTEPIQPLKGPQ